MHRQVEFADEPHERILSEFTALPSSRDRDPFESRPPNRHRSRRFDRRGQQPRNQIDRQIVFSENPIMQAVRDILITFHDDLSSQAILHAMQLYHQLPDDHTAHMNDIADVFIKALSTLPMEIPSIVTFVSIVITSHEDSTAIVFQKMESALIDALQNGIKGVFIAKMLLRSLACFTCCGVLASIGEGSMLGLLQGLLDSISAADEVEDSSCQHIALYLLASTLPYLAEKLTSEHADFIQSCESMLNRFHTSWSSEFDIDHTRAVFQVVCFQ